MSIEYSPQEKGVLVAVAVTSLAGLNVAFLYGLTQRGALQRAISNPIALAFILEAFLLAGMLAYLLSKWRVLRVSALAFVVLALIGGIAFALPVAVLWRRRE